MRLVSATLAGAFLEVAYVAHRPLPSFEGFDASTVIGNAAAPALRLAVLGDSTCTGPGLSSPDDLWCRVVARTLADRYRVELTSVAAGGAKVVDVLEGQLEAALALRPDVAIVSVGANDALRPIPSTLIATRLEAITAALAAVCPFVVLSGIGDLGTIPRLVPPLDLLARRRGRLVDRIHAEIAERHHNVVKIPMWELTAEDFRTRSDVWSPDLFHPSAAGHAVWARAALTVLAPRLLDAPLPG